MSDLTAPQGSAAAGTANQVVAMFETYGEALSARNTLVSAGIERSRIEILDRSAAERRRQLPLRAERGRFMGGDQESVR